MAARSPLDTLRIASPCSADWAQMRGTDRRRFCAECGLHVYDLAAMTRPEAEALLESDETPCIRLFRRIDGSILTTDCPVGARDGALEKLPVRKRIGGLAALMTGAAVLAATGDRVANHPPPEPFRDLVERSSPLPPAIPLPDASRLVGLRVHTGAVLGTPVDGRFPRLGPLSPQERAVLERIAAAPASR
jgi:hypothetical protein